MGFIFRKRIKIAPGLKVNVSNKGFNSLSIGRSGGTLNIGKKGTKATVGVPGSGISYSKKLTQRSTSQKNNDFDKTFYEEKFDTVTNVKSMVFFLGIGVLFVPYIFSWFLLQKGYSKKSRFIGFSWLVLSSLVLLTKNP